MENKDICPSEVGEYHLVPCVPHKLICRPVQIILSKERKTDLEGPGRFNRLKKNNRTTGWISVSVGLKSETM